MRPAGFPGGGSLTDVAAGIDLLPSGCRALRIDSGFVNGVAGSNTARSAACRASSAAPFAPSHQARRAIIDARRRVNATPATAARAAGTGANRTSGPRLTSVSSERSTPGAAKHAKKIHADFHRFGVRRTAAEAIRLAFVLVIAEYCVRSSIRRYAAEPTGLRCFVGRIYYDLKRHSHLRFGELVAQH
jgi:hypothetical protein